MGKTARTEGVVYLHGKQLKLWMDPECWCMCSIESGCDRCDPATKICFRVLGKYSFWEVIIEFPKIVVGWQYIDTRNKAPFIWLMDLDFRVWNSFPRIQKMTCSLVLAIYECQRGKFILHHSP
jgi:hypothetical protein